MEILLVGVFIGAVVLSARKRASLRREDRNVRLVQGTPSIGARPEDAARYIVRPNVRRRVWWR